MNNTKQIDNFCPFLGLMDDQQTSLGFPSNWNYCHHAQPIAPPRFRHQEEFCLGGKFGKCPQFARQQPAPLPKEIRIPRSGVDLSGRKTRTVFFIAMIILVAVLAVAWKIFRSDPSLSAPIIAQAASASSTLTPPTLTDAPPPTIQVSINPILTMTPVFVLTAVPDASPTLVTGRNQLEVPIGTDYKFVIHMILEGETMEGLAAKYHTSTEAIVAVNYTKRNPGWSGTLLVIPLDFVDFARLPSFIVYRVQEKDRGISVDGMAKYLHVTALNLKYYNGWTNEGDRPLVGDYLLVPRPRPIQ